MAYEVGTNLEVTAYEIDRFGQGVSTIDNLIVFTSGLLKDEKAIVTITAVKSNFIQTKIKKLITQSNARKTMTSRLGALDLYHLNDDAQNDWQQDITANLLSRGIGYNGTIMPTLSDQNSLNYRNKATYHVLDDPMMRLGLYMKEPIELVEVHTFILNSLAIQRCISKIQQQTIQIDSAIFKHVVLRSNEKDEVLVTLVAYKSEFTGLKELVDKIKTFKEVVGITLNIKPNEKTILGRESILLYGKNEIQFNLGTLKLKLNDRSFMQVNTEVMLKVYEEIKSHIHGETVIDCYSGIGSIGYYIGNQAKKITMIESNIENIEMAKMIHPFHEGIYDIILGDAKKVLPKINADILIVDPPRAGLDQSLLEVLNEKKFKKIIYLSCEPNTLIRDLKVLQTTYQITKILPVRMFPQTTSIETLVVLNQNPL